MTLRSGEVLVACAAGPRCAVCGARMEAGPAVQLSKWTARVRHVACVPAADRRFRRSPAGKTARRFRRMAEGEA